MHQRQHGDGFRISRKKIKEDAFNRDLRTKLDAERREFESNVAAQNRELQARTAYVSSLRSNLDSGVLNGRQWLAKFVAEADRAFDESVVQGLQSKKRPAFKAAEEVTAARAERRLYKERVKFLEYQLLSLKEYFPFLAEYEDVILDESVPLVATASNLEALEGSDPVLQFVAKDEYEKMSKAERNQLALNRYLSGKLSPVAIGKLYERSVGHAFEKDGWQVEYHGIVKGLEDLGRDLICTRGNEIQIVQAKCWSREKVIHEKHLFQLFGTTSFI